MADAPETFVTGLIGVYRASDVTGSPPTSLTDLSGNARTLTGSGATVTTRDGTPRLLVAGSGDYVASTATHWKDLSDGTGVTLWAVIRPTANGVQDVILDTGVASSAYVGFGIWQDTVKERLAISLCNGDGAGAVLTEYTWQGSWRNGFDHILVVTFDTAATNDIRVWIDGQLAAQFSLGVNSRDGDGLVLDTGDPNYPLKLFALNPSGSPFHGELAEVGVASGVVSTTDREAIEDWAAERYPGVVIDRGIYPQVLFDGNSLFSLASGEVRTINPETTALELRRKVSPFKSAVYGLRTGELTARAAKHVTPRYDAARSRNILVAWEFINSMASGELVGGDGGGATKEEIYDEYVAYCEARQTEGWKVVAVTLCPADGLVQADVEWVNAQLVANWPTFADALATPHLDPLVGSWAEFAIDEARETPLYRSDGTHWTDLGNTLLKPWFVAAIDPLLLGRVIVRKLP